MYLIFHSPMHHKNTEAIQNMCNSLGITLEFTNSFERVKEDNYDILIMNTAFINPNYIPKRVKIIYGPQHWVFPEGELVGPLDPEWSQRCYYNTLSKWTKYVFQELVESLKVPLVQIPFSVNINKFKPIETDKYIDCIIYYKRRNKSLLQSIQNTLQQKKLKHKIFSYGSYTENDYINSLLVCKYMIVLDASESQGFALEEAMSCNIPLLVFDATSMHDEIENETPTYNHMRSSYKLLATSIPYWSEECGIRITSIEEFPTALEIMNERWATFTPRNYILRTMSPWHCGTRMLNTIGYQQPTLTIVTKISDTTKHLTNEFIDSALAYSNSIYIYTPLDQQSIHYIKYKKLEDSLINLYDIVSEISVREDFNEKEILLFYNVEQKIKNINEIVKTVVEKNIFIDTSRKIFGFLVNNKNIQMLLKNQGFRSFD